MQQSKNDAAWERLFDRFKILEEIKQHQIFEISADEIKVEREPRLMTKFDLKVNLPKIFADNQLAILPISRGGYKIACFDAYKDFEKRTPEQVPVEKVCLPHVQSLSLKFLVSESIALNYAYASGILQDFLGVEWTYPTVSGRMGSGEFDFSIHSTPLNCSMPISVTNAQIEIDAAYESENCLALFEAKRDLADDFIVRQLYYPFRAWGSRIIKPVRTVFLVYSNGVFNLYEYQFADPRCYNSLFLVKRKDYANETGITQRDLEKLLSKAVLVPEPQVPFPQADKMSRIVNLIELLNERDMTSQEITSEYAFDERQTRYYTDAGRYLELIDRQHDSEDNNVYSLTTKGKLIMSLDYKERLLALAGQILQHQAFYLTLEYYFKHGLERPDTQRVVNIMKKSKLFGDPGESTLRRRSSTVKSWVEWILERVERKGDLFH